MRLSPMAIATYLAAPGLLAFFLLFFAVVVPTVPGKILGLAGIAALDYFLIRWLLRRLARIRATLTDQGVSVCNSARSGATAQVPWSEIATVDRGYRYFGSPFGLRGSMLVLSPRPGASWQPVLVFASYAARAQTCERVVARLKATAVAQGFSVSDRVGTRFDFTRPGTRWSSTRR